MLVLGSHYPYFHAWANIGWAGVDLFFVLSGFLISGLLFSDYQRNGRIDVGRFWIRRAFKIYPAFYTMIAFTALCLYLEHRPLPISLFHDSIYMGNYLSNFWDHTWSLAVEEHFYFVLPILLVGLSTLAKNKVRPFRAVPAVSIILTVVCLYLRNREFVEGAPWTSIEWPTHLRIDSLFAGVTLGYFYHFDAPGFGRTWPGWLWIGAASLMLPVVFLSLHGVFFPATFTLTFASFSCVIVAMMDRQVSRHLTARSLAFVGSRSYSIYLWHAVLVGLVFRFYRPTLLLFIAYLAASVATGVLLTALVEAPFLALRDWWFPSKGALGSATKEDALDLSAKR